MYSYLYMMITKKKILKCFRSFGTELTQPNGLDQLLRDINSENQTVRQSAMSLTAAMMENDANLAVRFAKLRLLSNLI